MSSALVVSRLLQGFQDQEVAGGVVKTMQGGCAGTAGQEGSCGYLDLEN